MKAAPRPLPGFSRIKKEYSRGVLPLIFLDFDGTLAPIVSRPSSARLPKKTRAILQALVQRFPVVVISGRDLQDIDARVGIDDVIYAGSHGLEWNMHGRRHVKHPGRRELLALSKARRSLLSIVPAFRGVVVEDKRRSFALNYRALSPELAAIFVEAAFAAIESYRPRLRILNELATFDVLPKVSWTKGQCSLAILEELRRIDKRDYLPVYFGDSLTDEDAFRALQDGVTIRVGNGKTVAKYRLPRTSVDTYLLNVLRLPENP